MFPNSTEQGKVQKHLQECDRTVSHLLHSVVVNTGLIQQCLLIHGGHIPRSSVDV